eukprot:7504756-Pyramimonas_sp.AAC.1
MGSRNLGVLGLCIRRLLRVIGFLPTSGLSLGGVGVRGARTPGGRDRGPRGERRRSPPGVTIV